MSKVHFDYLASSIYGHMSMKCDVSFVGRSKLGGSMLFLYPALNGTYNSLHMGKIYMSSA